MGMRPQRVLLWQSLLQDELSALLQQGQARRAVASTRLNSTSSRSHAAISLFFEPFDAASTHGAAKLIMVDLAGSERIKVGQP